MEQELLQFFGGLAVGFILGVVAMLIFNKVKSGSVSPAGAKQEFEDYKNEVEAHFEATSKKFQNMTEQYQDLYQHLSVGATSLCRPDSVAASLVDGSDPSSKPAQIEDKTVEAETKAETKANQDSQPDEEEPSPTNENGPQETLSEEALDQNTVDPAPETGSNSAGAVAQEGAAEKDKGS